MRKPRTHLSSIILFNLTPSPWLEEKGVESLMSVQSVVTPEDPKSEGNRSSLHVFNETVPGNPEKSEVPIDYTYQYRFVLPFGGHFIFGYETHGFGQCEVVLRKERNSNTIHVLIYEPHSTGSTSVTNRIENIATQVYWGFLTHFDPKDITWTIRYLKERGHAGLFFPQRLYWDGSRFWYSRDQHTGPLITYRVKRNWLKFWKYEETRERVCDLPAPAYRAKKLPEMIVSPSPIIQACIDFEAIWKGFETPTYEAFKPEVEHRECEAPGLVTTQSENSDKPTENSVEVNHVAS